MESKAASQRCVLSLDVSIIEIPLQYRSLGGLFKVLKKDTLYPSLISLPPQSDWSDLLAIQTNHQLLWIW